MIAHFYQKYIGLTVGDGHCVALVREAAGAPPTEKWRKGMKVRDGAWARGTLIATFDASGQYANARDGSSHAAILDGIEDVGLAVVDQWQGHPTAPRIIRFKNGSGDACDDGDRYFVIEIAAA